jgi:hypothetical protein
MNPSETAAQRSSTSKGEGRPRHPVDLARHRVMIQRRQDEHATCVPASALEALIRHCSETLWLPDFAHPLVLGR